ncbi:cupin [Microbacterium sp.]|uniref:cupin n=1 Tax=Microbacterium sp. TaxID=51671 RepID=UPI003F9CA085
MDAETAAALPRIVGDALTASDEARSVWKLEPAERGLDANVIVLPAGDEIQTHIGPALDVLIVVLDGSGTLETEADAVALEPGGIVWLPAKSQRRFLAGADGLRYFSVHARKPGLSIQSRA